jgi:predicted NUDIX family NTP pyrophosphohydrolase
MPRDEIELKTMVKKAAQVAKDHPTLKVPEVMRVAKFTLEESQDRMLQMCVRRLVDRIPASITVSHLPAQTFT